jgi:N-acetylglucosaminyldiphosphoundecaprenol N-acetyl-beta-D-mannosaminyltransferase
MSNAAPEVALPDPVPLVGTDLHPVTRDEALEAIVDLARSDDPTLVVTLNVDHAVVLQESTAFRQAYADARLRLCDGAPIKWLSALVGRPLPERVTGADLFPGVCRRAAEENLRVFVAGGEPEVLARGLANLRRRYPGLDITGHSPPLHFEDTEHDVELQARISAADPDIVAVCFGAPRSEIWAAQQQERHSAVHLCVGAAIDFAAGTKSRAPAWLQQLGLEWLFRLVQEPRRLWRRYVVRDSAFVPIAARELLRSERLGRLRRGGQRVASTVSRSR